MAQKKGNDHAFSYLTSNISIILMVHRNGYEGKRPYKAYSQKKVNRLIVIVTRWTTF